MDDSMKLAGAIVDDINAAIDGGADPGAVFQALQFALSFALTVVHPSNRKDAADTFARDIPATLSRAEEMAQEAEAEARGHVH